MKTSEIHLTDVLDILKAPTDANMAFILHDLEFISFDKKKHDKNGRKITLEGVYMVGQKNAWQNQTRGFRELATGNITAVHIRLLTKFNNKTIVW